MPKQLTTQNASITTVAVDLRSVRHPQLMDADWLRDRYETRGMSSTAIAEEVGCALATVQKRLKQHGIQTRRVGRRSVHGQTGSPTWISWHSMRARCSIPSHHKWELYGGRGITITHRWLEPDGRGFANFLADMGERPDGTTLDRIDPDGNYEPWNCRWADAVTQRANRRDSRSHRGVRRP